MGQTTPYRWRELSGETTRGLAAHGILLTLMLALSSNIFLLWPVCAVATAADFCLPLVQINSTQQIKHIRSGDIQALMYELSKATSNTIFLLADGIYRLGQDQSLEVNTAKVTIRSASGKRGAVIIEGGYNNISINSDDVTVADLTL